LEGRRGGVESRIVGDRGSGKALASRFCHESVLKKGKGSPKNREGRGKGGAPADFYPGKKVFFEKATKKSRRGENREEGGSVLLPGNYVS